MAVASSSAGPEGKAQRDTPSRILLDLEGYIADCSNATTAWSKTSTGVPISVSFCISRPPVLSHFFVHSPGLDLAALPVPPKAICSDADLVLLRVPLDPDARSSQWHSDYFVYTMHPRRPKLDLLPNPCPARFADDEIAVLSCGGGGGGYVVAGLKVPAFELHLYRSVGAKPGTTRRWTIQKVSMPAPVRDTACPVPDSAENQMFHTTAKTIAIGGEGGTVGWVDLWRGILLCDLLSPESPPKLRDVPLPPPARGNWENFLNHHRPCFYRDVAVVGDRRETIKYVEMEIAPPEHVPVFPCMPEPATFTEWVNRQNQEECEQPESYTFVPGSWTATTYSLPIPVGSWEDWRRDSCLRLGDLKLPGEDARCYKLMQKLVSSSVGQEQEDAEATTLSLGYLNMAYPTIGGDGDEDTIYLMSKGTYRGSMAAVVSVDVKAGTLQGVAKLESQMHAGFKRCCLASEISKYTRIW
ncbi:unnamed protein product [Urochloa decumbens]|uniref:DUF1618 domain-containing protein n=1 Tax=Urochloa decumbens TaxID=240449 RepID=A0ABC9BVF1_9POAL